MARIGLCFVSPAPLTKFDAALEMAKACEPLGLDSFWSIDRIAYDNLEPLTLLAAAAAVTEKIRLGTSVLLAATRHPVHLAKIVATLDFLSRGRITLGIGFGSRENDFRSVEIPFTDRGSRAVEQVRLIKRLWTEENVTHHGRFYRVENLTIGPKPLQKPHPPIWTGGSSETALKRAGTWADGYICGSSAIADFPAVWEKVAAYARAAGRDPESIERAALTFIAIDDRKDRAIARLEAYLTRYYGRVRGEVDKTYPAGAPRECAAGLAAAFAKGLQTLIVGLADPDPRQVDLFGERVLPELKSLLSGRS
ncbi:MAG TPA: LLM class flavin-dependent oxidoreductase [candidate division Zixibacteria bacterium]|nr:LLM class flavin-dependent oxidoreductase [candidate division Zixibacteria bacterium]